MKVIAAIASALTLILCGIIVGLYLSHSIYNIPVRIQLEPPKMRILTKAVTVGMDGEPIGMELGEVILAPPKAKAKQKK